MESFVNIFTTREQAIIIWISFLMIWALSQQKLRLSFYRVIKAFLQKQIVVAFLLMFFYIIVIVFMFSRVNLWDFSLLKDTIFWVIGSAIILFVNINKAQENCHYFTKTLLDNFKFVLVLLFFINFYTFHLFVELLMMPLLSLLVLISVVVDMKKEHAVVKKFVDYFLGISGISLLLYAISKAISDYQNLMIFENVRIILLPLLLTFAFLPFLYGLTLYMAYNSIFVRLNFFVGNRDKELMSIAKRKILCTYNINYRRLFKFLKESAGKLLRIESLDELDDLLS